MKITNHKLYADNGVQLPYYQSPNYTNFTVIPKFLVMHYTTGAAPIATISWFQKKESYVSAHLLIDREGKIYQFLPFNIMGWHAGDSKYRDPDNKETILSGINKYSVGIELDNGGCASWVQNISSDRKIWAKHPNMSYSAYWEKYTAAQITSLIEVSKLLVSTYGFKAIVGHDDISPGYKVDPGPAFPMQSVKDAVLGNVQVVVPLTLEERVAKLEEQMKKLLGG